MIKEYIISITHYMSSLRILGSLRIFAPHLPPCAVSDENMKQFLVFSKSPTLRGVKGRSPLPLEVQQLDMYDYMRHITRK